MPHAALMHTVMTGMYGALVENHLLLNPRNSLEFGEAETDDKSTQQHKNNNKILCRCGIR